MIIHPNTIVTPDRPIIQFREPREHVDLDKKLPQILSAQGWGVGTYFDVQFISHDRTTLLACGRFIVVSVNEGLHTSEANPYQPITKSVFTRRAEQVGDWWLPADQAARAEQKTGLDALEGENVEQVAPKTEQKASKSVPKRKAG